MIRARFRHVLAAVAVAAAVALSSGQSPYEKNLEIRTSRIPHAGNGVYTKVAIPKGAYLGAYTGEFITEEEYRRRLESEQVAVHDGAAGLRQAAHRRPHDHRRHLRQRLHADELRAGRVPEREVREICEAPFVRILALRDIAAGEELWVDYGPRYRYDFMDDPAVVKFFADLRAQRGKEGRAGW